MERNIHDRATKKAIFHLERDFYQELTTLGEMLTPDAEHFGHTLEDVVRPYGIKDKHYTAIPETQGDDTYMIDIRQSPKYGEVAVVYTSKEGDKYILEYGGIRFEYILVHGGNKHENTSGCILTAKNRNDKNRTIQGSLKKEFVAEVKKWKAKGFDTRLRVTNLPQAE